MKTRPLLWQLFPANLLITLGALLLITWYTTSTVRDVYFAQVREGLTARARLIEPQVVELAQSSGEALQNYCRQTGRQAATRITVVAPDGTVLADSSEDPARMANHAGRPELQNALSGMTGSAVRTSNTLGKKMLYTAIPLTTPAGDPLGALRVAVSVSSIENVLHDIYLQVFFGCILVIISATVVTLIVSRQIIRPLAEMEKGAELMARGDTDHIPTPDTTRMSSEVFALAKSLNRLARQIKERIRTITLQHNELETVFSSMAEMVLAVDRERRIIRLNRSAAALFYLAPDDVQGKSLHGVIRNSDLHEIVDEVLSSGTQTEKDIVLFVGPDKIYLHTRAVPLNDGDNQPIGVLIVLNDMTRLYRLENLRRDFVANVSHELKTPVTSIQGYVETLLDGALDNPDDARRFLEIVARQTARLDAIIDDLLTLSRIELKTDYSDITVVEANLKDILAGAVQTCLKKAAEKNITLIITCEELLQAVINPNLMEQAVINLLTNAITYSSAGSEVAVTADLEQHSRLGRRLIITVRDQGIGIERQHQERLFERFYRCDRARSSAQGGTGLGLSIVKHIAVVHGGSVTVRSEPGKGSIFSIVIPQ